MMRQLIFRSLRFYAPSHLGSLLGVTVAATVLVGALAVGDCVRESLREMGLARLGKIDFALPGKDRLFRGALADDLRPGLSNGLAAAVLLLPGTAANSDGSQRANHAQVLGVDERFWALAQSPPKLAGDWTSGAVLNEPLARQLGVKTGDTILLRVQKPSLLSLEAPISPQEDLAFGISSGGEGDCFRRGIGAVWFAGQPNAALERVCAAAFFAGQGRPGGQGEFAAGQWRDECDEPAGIVA